MKEILDFLENRDHVYIWGGKFGRSVKNAIEIYRKDDWFSGFVCFDENAGLCIETQETGGNTRLDPAENDGIIIAVEDDVLPAVIEEIVRCGVRNIHIARWEEKEVISAVSEMLVKGISFENDTLDFGKFKIPNVFKLAYDEYEVLGIVGLECFDLILPRLGFLKRLDEGLYEYGNVHMTEGDVVIDCGANVGLFSAQAAAKGCEVYAFEPADKPLKYLEMTRDLYPEKINIVKYALGDFVGKSDFTVSSINIGQNSIVKGHTKGSKTTVDITTLDAFVEENRLTKVDFIKADIEGAERMMLTGAADTLKRFAPKLSLCTYHRWDDIQVMSRIIRDCNPDYKIEYAWKKLYAWV